MSRVVFIDTETGGLDPEVHSILSVGACYFDVEKLKVLETFYGLIAQDPVVVSLSALEINKLDLRQFNIKGAKTTEKLLEMFYEWLDRIKEQYNNTKLIAGGHNIHFDISFLKRQLKFDWDGYFRGRIIDSQMFSHSINDLGIKLNSHSLGYMAKELQVDNHNYHNALSDAITSAMCYGHMVRLIRERMV